MRAVLWVDEGSERMLDGEVPSLDLPEPTLPELPDDDGDLDALLPPTVCPALSSQQQNARGRAFYECIGSYFVILV